jgi:hypothetical protein
MYQPSVVEREVIEDASEANHPYSQADHPAYRDADANYRAGQSENHNDDCEEVA